MEKLSSFERVVGNIPENEKEQILSDRGERFDNQVFEDLKNKEREKTPEELKIIHLANETTNKIGQKYGLKKFNIPPENIHIIKEEEWPEEDKGTSAYYAPMLQGIAVREQPGRIVFMKKIFHEMLHFKSYNALQITNEKDPKIKNYRVGLTVNTRDGKEIYFKSLNEASTEELTKRFISKIYGNSLFAEEKIQTKNVIAKYPRMGTPSGEPLFSKDTFYAEVESRKSWRETAGRLFGVKEKSKKIAVESFTYASERKILNILIGKIVGKNPDKFQDREEVFEVFVKGMMTGNILPVGKLIDKTFGSGTLRKIGELDQNMEAQEEFVNSL